VTVRRSFGLQRSSVSASRQFVDAAVSDLVPEAREAAVLMMSELATNAVVHAATGFEVGITRSETVLRVEVTDVGGGRPALRSPTSREPHGRGLQIVKELSDHWGMSALADDAGKTVWFEILLGSGPDAEAEADADGRTAEPHRKPRSRRGESTGQNSTPAPVEKTPGQDGPRRLPTNGTGHRTRLRSGRRSVLYVAP
jgi:anti-sigma regulatory factor (Ser/Thr protein kinase)